MSLSWLGISNAIHNLEEMSLPKPSSYAVFMAAVLGIPVAVLLHDTSSYWMPKHRSIPVLSWFVRKWRSESNAKADHLRIFRNAVIFAWITAVMQEKDPRETPLDYVSDRISSANARRSMTQSVYAARSEAFEASGVMAEEDAHDAARASMQRDAALRRRHAHEARNQLL